MRVYRPARGIRVRPLLLVTSLFLTISAVAAGAALGGSPAPTKGIIPPEAFQPGKQIDPALVPDYIVALGRDGKPVGYVSKELALGLTPDPLDDSGRPMAAVIPVYGGDLVTIVGHMVPDLGFVPLGTDPESIPRPEVEVAPVTR
jgi:hypothetical protein